MQIAILPSPESEEIPTSERTIPDEIIARAKAELGKGENGKDNQGQDLSRYRRAIGSSYEDSPWCAEFASYILRQTSKTLIAPHSLSKNLQRQFKAVDAYHAVGDGYIPAPGDLIFFDRGEWKGHVGFLLSIEADGTIRTIEGNKANPKFKGQIEGRDYNWSPNSPDQVREVSYPPNDPERMQILGYGSIAAMSAAKNLTISAPSPTQSSNTSIARER